MMNFNVTSHYVFKLDDFKRFVKVIGGVSKKGIKRLREQIENLKGTPQEPRDWKDPRKWITQLLKENKLDKETKAIAEKIHMANLNPRFWNWEAVRIAVRHKFIDDTGATYKLTETGKCFSDGEKKVVDEYLFENGIFKVLEFLADDNGANKEELIKKWEKWINREIGKNVRAKNVLSEGVLTRIDNVLIPSGYVRKEGIPRRYFITEKGVKKIQEVKIGFSEKDRDSTEHEFAVNNILEVGRHLGYDVQARPKLRDLLPREKKALNLDNRVYNKELDGFWKTNLPIVGEIKIPIEVQSHGNVPDLLMRLKVIAPYSHFMIIVSDKKQIEEIEQFISAQGEEKIFTDKVIYLTFDELSQIKSQVSYVSSKLKPAYIKEEVELTETSEID